ncbi:hypothetical protein YPC_1512 [Yersinia pestis biovar Medievalis str. Harbin 35]|nr:hypothetical protein YPC_1512 [Yersinia pestis biovar Medievalis str. Harbin 35]EEO76252.1 hypothetical protein YP516_2449 [Yersinia pestis Nepal516]EEO80512.1 hypothetical protein YPF_3335 [Yersinia pestis biovar Orientalis str. India 195]EEO84740.1 hypothetical protein YPH_0560 [Yersinia pestis biovar Orientalis str. PEXU2]EEO89691.1 hypothetical protein YPS_3142 [Yersinia pestis Pestoides A]
MVLMVNILGVSVAKIILDGHMNWFFMFLWD